MEYKGKLILVHCMYIFKTYRNKGIKILTTVCARLKHGLTSIFKIM